MVPTVIQEQSLSQIELDDLNLHLPVDEVFVGDKARRYVKERMSLAVLGIL